MPHVRIIQLEYVSRKYDQLAILSSKFSLIQKEARLSRVANYVLCIAQL